MANFRGSLQQFTGDLKDIQNIRKQLQQYGLDIIEEEREVEVLVIRDKKKVECNKTRTKRTGSSNNNR